METGLETSPLIDIDIVHAICVCQEIQVGVSVDTGVQ